MIGLSGLITPSLEEMCTVAAEMERRGMTMPLHDRRRDHQQGAHRDQDRPLLQPRPGRLRAGRLARRRRRQRAGRRRSSAPRSRRRSRPSTGRSRSGAPAGAPPAAGSHSSRRARTACASTGTPYTPVAPPRIGVQAFDDYDLGEIARYIDWTPFFRTWELKGTFPKILDDPDRRRGRARPVRATRRRCSSGWSPSAGSPPRRWSDCGPPTRTATTSVVYADRAGRTHAGDAAHAAPAARARSASTRISRSPTSSPRSAPAWPTTSARSPSPPAIASTSAPSSSSATTTTTTRSSSPRSATGSPRRSPSACTSACAASSGATPRTSSSRGAELIAERYRGHPPRARLRLPTGPHREADDLRAARRPRARRDPADRELRDDSRLIGLRAVPRAPESRYFGVGRIGTDQLEDYAARKGWSVDEARRWLATLIDEEPVGELRRASAS